MTKNPPPIYGPCYARPDMQCPHDKRYVDRDIICVACSENGTKDRLTKKCTITNEKPPELKKTHPGGKTSITAGAALSPSYTHTSNLMAPRVQGKDAGRRLFLPGEHVSQRNRDQLNVRFKYDEKIIDKIKKCAGRWQPKEKLWTVPLTAKNIELLKEMGFRIPADVSAPEPAKPLVIDHNFHESLYNPRAVELYEHQKKYGVSVLGKNNFACLHWDCGVGKTLPMVMIVQHVEKNKEKLPALIVCPAGVIDSWKEEFEKFTNVKPVILAGTPAKRKKLLKSSPEGVFICSYDVMTNDCTILVELKLRLVCFDEMQYLRNMTTGRVKAAINLTAYIPNRYGLTGTPIGNSPLDIFAQMLIIQPSIFGPSQAAFRTKYFINKGFSFIHKKTGKKIQTQDWHPKPGALDQIREKISAVCHRLTKAEALPWLPEKTFQVIKVQMSTEQRAVYNAIKTEARFKIAGAENKHIEKGAQLIRLLQVCGGHFGNAESYKTIPHNKIKELRRLWEDSGRRPMVVWVRFTPDLWEIEKEFRKDGAVTFHGKNTREQNTENRHLFQDGKAPIIICNEASGGEGITLTAGNFVVIYGQGYSALKRVQKIDRTHRPGQKNNVLYIDLVCENSKELEVLEAVEKYREMSAEMLGDNTILDKVMENL